MSIVENKRGRGRPPAFDREVVLDRAMAVFWGSGYAAASVPMLTAAMGISAQSLYAAFGSKDALYRESIQRYRSTIGAFADRALEEGADAVAAITTLLRESATLFTRTADTPGCMITTAPAGVIDEPLTLFGRQLRADGVRKIEQRLLRGVREGELAPATDCAAWARHLSGVLQGMSTQARDGATTAALLATVDITAGALRSLRRRPSARSEPASTEWEASASN